MKKYFFCSICFAAVVVSVFLIASNLSPKTTNPKVLANIEALSWQETPNGIFYECADNFCMVFKYRNRFLVAGCKYDETSICTVQETDFPGLDISF